MKKKKKERMSSLDWNGEGVTLDSEFHMGVRGLGYRDMTLKEFSVVSYREFRPVHQRTWFVRMRGGTRMSW